MNPASLARIEEQTGKHPVSHSRLTGGCIADVYLVDLADGERVVVKESGTGSLAIEAWMLGYLSDNSNLPVPCVVYGDDDLLVMDYIDNDGGAVTESAQEHAADLLADLHTIKADRYGLERNTLIGSLDQPNPEEKSWVTFFRDHRLHRTAQAALAKGALSDAAFVRIEKLCARLDEWILEPDGPSLIHGDMWGGNVLVLGGRIAGFVDPAIYYADPEIELAFSTLFGTFGEAFFSRYEEHRPIEPGFFEIRRDIYNLYPLLVHAVLFGGDYGASADSIVRRTVG